MLIARVMFALAAGCSTESLLQHLLTREETYLSVVTVRWKAPLEWWQRSRGLGLPSVPTIEKRNRNAAALGAHLQRSCNDEGALRWNAGAPLQASLASKDVIGAQRLLVKQGGVTAPRCAGAQSHAYIPATSARVGLAAHARYHSAERSPLGGSTRRGYGQVTLFAQRELKQWLCGTMQARIRRCAVVPRCGALSVSTGHLLRRARTRPALFEAAKQVHRPDTTSAGRCELQRRVCVRFASAVYRHRSNARTAPCSRFSPQTSAPRARLRHRSAITLIRCGVPGSARSRPVMR